jgi:hypothetical protein
MVEPPLLAGPLTLYRRGFMMNVRWKWWLGAALLLCLVPSSFAGEPDHHKGTPVRNVRSCQVPEGGSAAIYLLGAGLTCFGAMFLRSKVAKPTQS